MNAVLAIIAANLRRMRNDRSNIFFVIVLPLLIVVTLGLAFGGDTNVKLGVVDPVQNTASRDVHTAISGTDEVAVEPLPDIAHLRHDVARGVLDGGWYVTRSGTGDDETTVITWVSGTTGNDIPMQNVAMSAARVASDRAEAVRIVTRTTGGDAVAAARAVDRASASGPRVERANATVGSDKSDEDSTSIRAVLAGSQLSLFIFLTSLMGASSLLTSRQYGVTRRTRAAPVSVRQIIAGEALSRYIVAIIQAAVILLGSTLLFGIDWHSPLAVILLCAAMALVGSGIAMILGTLGRSEQQVNAISLLAGLALAALGGSMQPLEFFPDVMRTIAFCVTPHAWMNNALWRILIDGKGFSAAVPAIIVLSTAGLVLIAIASRLLARRLRAM